MKVKIAITGGIGSGKSKVLSIIENEGYAVFSCDQISREVMTEKRVLKQIKKNFPSVFTGVFRNKLDRKELAKKVFNNQEKVDLLNAIMHPVIMERLLQKVEEGKNDINFIEIPLLFEGDFQNMFDEVIVVMRPLGDRIESVRIRSNLTISEIEDRIKNQVLNIF